MGNGVNAVRGATARPPASKEPYFDTSAPQNVSALIGKSAYLTCKVRNIGNRTVSWVRHRDIHILTVSTYTYTSDQRFMALHQPQDDDWTLQIKWVQKRDAGVYECQISTLPVQGYFVNLNIVVPTATIVGGPDIYVNYGSTINLTCTITHSTEPPPAYIFWYYSKEDDNTSTNSGSTKGPVRVVSYDSERGGVSIITDKGEVTTSRLLITNALPSDEGRYSCSPSNADMATVRVHVLSGKHSLTLKVTSEVIILQGIPSGRLIGTMSSVRRVDSSSPRTFSPWTKDATPPVCPMCGHTLISQEELTFLYTGESPAAMQTGASTSHTSDILLLLLFILCSTFTANIKRL